MKAPNLLHNTVALASVQVASYLLPLITVPYVTRVLGLEVWGKVAFVQIVLTYFTRVTDWGFSWSATRKVAVARERLPQLSLVFLATWAAQWLLAIGAVIVLVLLIVLVPFFQKDRELYLFGIGVIVSSVLFPTWFLNGLERMKEVAAIQIAGRVASVALVFLVIRTREDAPLMIAIGAGAGMLSGILTIAWIWKNAKLTWQIPKPHRVWLELRQGAGVFVSTVSISFYTTLVPTLLGILMGPVAVGQFVLADRARTAAQSTLQPVSQALFPRMSYLFAHDPIGARRLIKQSGLAIAGFSASVSLLLWLAAEPTILFLGGREFIQASVVLKWLAPLPFIIGMSNLFGVQIMLPSHKTKAFNLILSSAALVSLCMTVPLLRWKAAEGASISILIAECLVTTTMGLYLLLKGFFFLPERWANP